MIKARELRIGNILMDSNSGKWYRVRTISEEDDFEKMGMAPIPLTPEILEKCRLKQEGSWFFFEGISFLCLAKVGDEFILKSLWKPEQQGALYDNRITKNKNRYLHQLQNLYFALTTEELTVNL